MHGDRDVEDLGIDLHLAALDLAQVEHVVDEPEQMARIALYLPHVGSEVPGLGTVLHLLLQHLAVADDGRERRSQLVAHVGDERRFGDIRLLGGIPGRSQELLGPFARVDVRDHHDAADEALLGIPHRGAGKADPSAAPVASLVVDLQLRKGFAVPDDLQQRPLPRRHGTAVLMEADPAWRTLSRARRHDAVPEDRLGADIVSDDPARGRLRDQDPDRERVEHGPQRRLADANPRFRLSAFDRIPDPRRDALDQRDVPRRPAARLLAVDVEHRLEATVANQRHGHESPRLDAGPGCRIVGGLRIDVRAEKSFAATLEIGGCFSEIVELDCAAVGRDAVFVSGDEEHRAVVGLHLAVADPVDAELAAQSLHGGGHDAARVLVRTEVVLQGQAESLPPLRQDLIGGFGAGTEEALDLVVVANRRVREGEMRLRFAPFPLDEQGNVVHMNRIAG